MPDLWHTQRNRRIAAQLLLHLGQRQIGLLNKPGSHLLLYLNTRVGLAPRSVRHTLRLAGTVASSRNLLRPTDAHNEPACQFLKRSFALVVGEQQFAAQVISKGFPMFVVAAEYRQK